MVRAQDGLPMGAGGALGRGLAQPDEGARGGGKGRRAEGSQQGGKAPRPGGGSRVRYQEANLKLGGLGI